MSNYPALGGARFADGIACPALPVHCIFDKNLIPGGGERRGGGLSWGTGRDYHGTPRLVAWIALIKGTSTFSIEVPSPSDTTHLGRKRKLQFEICI